MGTFERFNSYFKKGEQVLVGFREGSTHGYVSNVDINGIYLIQLNHAKEYFYTWKQCEVVCHAGYLIKRVKPNEVTKLIMVSIGDKTSDNSIRLAPEPKKKKDNSFKLMEEFKKKQFSFGITIKEAEKFMKNYFSQLWELYNSELFNKAKEYKDIQTKALPKTSKDEFFLMEPKFDIQDLKWERNKDGEKDTLKIIGSQITGEISLYYQGTVCSFPSTKNIGVQTVRYGEGIKIIKPTTYSWKSIPMSTRGIKNILSVVTREDLQEFIDEFRYISSGDPYELSGKPISAKMWKSDQGYCMLNSYAELYADVF